MLWFNFPRVMGSQPFPVVVPFGAIVVVVLLSNRATVSAAGVSVTEPLLPASTTACCPCLLQLRPPTSEGLVEWMLTLCGSIIPATSSAALSCLNGIALCYKSYRKQWHAGAERSHWRRMADAWPSSALLVVLC